MIQRDFYFAVCAYWSLILSAAGVQFQIPYLQYCYLAFLTFILIIFCGHLQDIGRNLLGFKVKVSQVWWLEFSAETYILLLLLSTFFLTTLAPSSSWDFLSYWSLEILTHLPNDPVFYQVGLDFEPDKHPWIISGALTSALSLGPIPGHPGLFWFGLLCISLATLKTMAALLDLGALPLLAAFLVFLNPLVENHYAYFGYAEASLAVAISIFIVCTHIAFNYNSVTQLLLAVLTALSLLAIKTSGLFFCIICLLSLVLTYISRRTQKPRLVFMFALFGFCAIVCFILFSQGLAIAMLKTGTALRLASAPDLISIFSQGFLYNQSFSVAVLLTLFCFFYLTQSGYEFRSSSGLLCVTFILCGILSFGIIFTLTEYGFFHSLPGQDTSFSRLFVSYSSPLAIFVLLVIKQLRVDNCKLGGRNSAEEMIKGSSQTAETPVKFS